MMIDPTGRMSVISGTESPRMLSERLKRVQKSERRQQSTVRAMITMTMKTSHSGYQESALLREWWIEEEIREKRKHKGGLFVHAPDVLSASKGNGIPTEGGRDMARLM